MYIIMNRYIYYPIGITFTLYGIKKLYKYFFNKKTVASIYHDPNREYIRKNTTRFLQIIMDKNNEKNNENIDKIVYLKSDFFEVLSDPNNRFEPVWKKRILIENTPRGNIYMYYDIFKQGFAYYSDQTGIPYPILNAVAMRYVTIFRCMDFFFDESLTTSPLIKVFIDDDQEEKKKKQSKMDALQINMKDAPFAKFKSYSSEKKPDVNLIKPLESKQSKYSLFYNKILSWILYCLGFQKKTEQKEIESMVIVEKKDKIINKFIFMGYTKNFSPLQKPVLDKSTNSQFSNQYDTMFSQVRRLSYMDYKQSSKEEGNLLTTKADDMSCL